MNSHFFFFPPIRNLSFVFGLPFRPLHCLAFNLSRHNIPRAGNLNRHLFSSADSLYAKRTFVCTDFFFPRVHFSASRPVHGGALLAKLLLFVFFCWPSPRRGFVFPILLPLALFSSVWRWPGFLGLASVPRMDFWSCFGACPE